MEKKYYFRGLGLGIVVTAVIMGIALSGGGKKTGMTDDEVIARAKELGMIEDSRLLEPSGAQEENQDAEKQDEASEPVKEDGTAANPAKKDEAATNPAKKNEAAEPANKDEAAANPAKKNEAAEPVKKDEAEESVKKDDAADPVAAEESGRENAGDESSKEPAGGSAIKDLPAKKSAAGTNEMTKQDDEPEQAGNTPSSAGKTGRVTITSGDGSYTVARKLMEAGVVASAESFDTFLCENGFDKKLRTGTFQIPANASDEQIARIVTGQE